MFITSDEETLKPMHVTLQVYYMHNRGMTKEPGPHLINLEVVS